MMKNHDVCSGVPSEQVRYELRPVRDPRGTPARGLHAAWIVLDNPKELNSYTTDMAKEVVRALRRASLDRSVVAVVLTGSGDRAFCTGGNTREYATYYAGNPQEYRQYMRVFNDMIDGILRCDRPVVCRVNGLRVGGGQELGMACDFSIAQDLARFGQAGPKHGSAPVGGATDFLPLLVGVERAMESVTLCEQWSAHKALRLGMITDVVPALRVDGVLRANPLVELERYADPATGRIVHGEPRTGAALDEGKRLLARGSVDLGPLDERIDALLTMLLMTMPECLGRTVKATRDLKVQAWNRNSEVHRDWLALNMMTEGRAGFQAFHSGDRSHREVDFVRLRQRLADGAPWTPELLAEILPRPAEEGAPTPPAAPREAR